MAQLSMPLIIMNMGGEMVYILDQRLRAQEIAPEKSKTVLGDVVNCMFNTQFIDELFKPQPAYHQKATRVVFDRLAHSSIMRLNKNSMDKLYDLMLMGFKSQLLRCKTPSQLLDVTLNHLRTLQELTSGSDQAHLLETATQKTLKHEWWALKAVLHKFFQDKRIKVSLFLQDGIQNLDGTIVIDRTGPVPPGSEVPGSVRFFSASGAKVRESSIPVLGSLGATAAYVSDSPGSSTYSCNLGLNLYAADRPAPSKTVPKPGPDSGLKSSEKVKSPEPKKEVVTTESAKAGLNLLASLVGGSSSSSPSTFKLNLFSESVHTAPTSGSRDESESTEVITIDASDKSRLQEMFASLDLDFDDAPDTSAGGGGGGGGDDLLSLMDSAGQ